MKGPFLALGFLGDLPLPLSVEYASKAEGAGIDRIWLAEHLGQGRDAVSLATALAIKCRRCRIGFGILSPFTRHPAVIAVTIASLAELLGEDRLVLALGLGNPLRLDKIGIRVKSPLRAVKEGLEMVRGLLRGEAISYEGSTFRAKDLSLGFRSSPLDVPLYLAAVGPKMLRLAVELGDGVLLSYASSKGHLRLFIEEMEGIRKGVERAALIAVSLDDDDMKAKRDLARRVLPYLLRPGRGERMCEASGLDPALPSKLRRLSEEEGIQELLKEDRVLEFGLAGSVEKVGQQLEELRGLGLHEVILVPSPLGFPKLLEGLPRILT